jgi:glycosyltransferase involved in cell wall biosynthesis
LYQPKNSNFQKKLADIKWYSLAEQLKMGRIVRAERADLCHFPHFNVPFFCRTPYVVTIHDLILRHYPTSAASTKNPVIFYLKYFFYNLILWRALRRAKKIITPSYFVRNDIIKSFKINPDKVRVIYEGLSNLPQTDLGEEYLKAKNIAPPYLLYIGNCYPHKNLERLIEAFNILKKENSDLKLVLVGKRDRFSQRLENYELRITNYELQKDIIFYGYASDEELVTLYKHASLYVFPSLMEGFGLPPLEALSFGLPSAVSDIPVFHEILGASAFYFKPDNAGDIARVIQDALQNNDKRDKILEEGRRVLSRYNSTRHAEESKEVYHAAQLSL